MQTYAAYAQHQNMLVDINEATRTNVKSLRTNLFSNWQKRIGAGGGLTESQKERARALEKQQKDAAESYDQAQVTHLKR